MVNTITQLDLTRSILWEHEDPKDKDTCEALGKLYKWLIGGELYTTSDTEISAQMRKVITNFNKHRELARAITKVQVVKRERVDDLIYD
jgi:hypothetical protein